MAELLIMAMTRMRSGICTAGFMHDATAPKAVRWVRPVKEHGTLLVGDMTTATGEIVEMGDVVELALLEARPQNGHVEDWVTDFFRHRPRIVRQLTGEKRAHFLANHCDPDPAEVLLTQSRSLCLIQPDDLWATFTYDPYSGKYDTRLGFRLSAEQNLEATQQQVIPVTDLKWRSLGREWLGDTSRLQLDQSELTTRLGADTFFLSIGLGRPHKGKQWPLVIGVHPVPDYEIGIDYSCL
jgi:hypothetical protein